MTYNSVLGPLAPQPEVPFLTDNYSTSEFEQIKSLIPNLDSTQTELSKSSSSIPPSPQPPKILSNINQEHIPSKTDSQLSSSPPKAHKAHKESKTTKTISTNNNNMSTPKVKKKWSLTGRLFEKRRSLTENSDIPNAPLNSNSNNSNSSNKSSTQSASNNRRSSLVDIPKALLTSLRRASLTSSSESKDKSSQPSYPSKLSIATTENNDANHDVPVATDTKMTEATATNADLTVQGPAEIMSLVEQPNETQTTPAEEVRESPSTNDNDNSPSPQTQENIPASNDLQLGLVEESSVPAPTSQFESGHEHQIDLYSQNEAIVTDSKDLSNKSIFKPIEIDQDYLPSPDTEISPQFIPGLQSNISRDRADRSQGLMTDPYIGEIDSIGMGNGYPSQPHSNHDPFAMSGIVLHQGLDVSAAHPSLPVSQSQRSSLSSQGSDDMMYELCDSDGESYHDAYMDPEVIPIPIKKVNMPIKGIRKSPHLPTKSPGSDGKRRSITFTDTIEVIPVHRKSEYNRRSDRNATFRVLTPDMKAGIREELNKYKMREMAVHVRSMSNTAFH